ncbi:MAG TPA: hypothetical protein VFX30_11800 [bacterium]|nr:hypothetical protein [bacterium]
MRPFLAVFLAVCCVLGAASSPAEELELKSMAYRPLAPLMEYNFQTLLELQEYAASPKPLRDPVNYSRLSRLIDRLAGIAHALPEMTVKERPGLSAVGAVYEDYLNDLKAGLASGDSIALRNRIRTAAGFCFECHASASGTGFSDARKQAERLRLSPFQKAEFLAATGQFEDALKAYKGLLASGPAESVPFVDLTRAVRNALILAVRVKQDAALAEEILGLVKKHEDLSASLGGTLGAWEKDLAAWMKDKSGKAVNAGDRLEKARSLVRRAESLQTYPADHAGDLSYLRAIASAQEALALGPNALQKAEAFSILAQAHFMLEDPLLWNLDGYYWEACVEAAPHTPQARECFQRWVQDMSFHYTGSFGNHLPEEASKKLIRLKDFAN